MTLLAAVALDWGLGDPNVRWHPVRLVGRCIEIIERFLREIGWTNRSGGVALLLAVLCVSGGPVLLFFSMVDSPVLQFLAGSVVVYFSISLKSLLSIACRIRTALAGGRPEEARSLVSEICGRDTERLNEAQMSQAAVESVAENSVDGFTAPLFYAALLGPAGAWMYRIANTLDSMVGHKDETYIRFGWASARFDDVLNFVPARLTAALFGLWAPVVGGSVSESFSTLLRFSGLHPSPNAGWTESATAGALGIRLGGPAFYGGEEYPKPFLGTGIRPPAPNDIRLASRLAFFASMTFVVALCAISALIA